MSVPDFQSILLPLLKFTASREEITTVEAYSAMAEHFKLSPDDLGQSPSSGTGNLFRNRVGWAKQYLMYAALVERVRRGVSRATPLGRAWAAEKSTSLKIGDFKEIPGYSERVDGSGGEGDTEGAPPNLPTERTDPEYTRTVIEQLYPDTDTRMECCRWLAEGIAYVNAREPASWGLTLRKRNLRLNVGRMLSLDLLPDGVRIGLAVDAVELANQGRLESHWEGTGFAVTPKCQLCLLEATAFLELRAGLREPWFEFLRIAMRTGRQTPFRRSHSPGVVAFLESHLAVKIPQPAYRKDDERDEQDRDGEMDAGPLPAIRMTRPSALFKPTNPDLDWLLPAIESGDIGLPEMQRAFVWSATKVRDLLDSMYRGFPVGYLLFWETPPTDIGGKTIGLDAKVHEPRLFIVDGQQRLTSLFAVLKGKPVRDKDFREVPIVIAFRPRDSRFEVASAATRKDPEFIPNISILWTPEKRRVIREFVDGLQRRGATRADLDSIEDNLERLVNLTKYKFSALEIMSSADEEEVADIFVRINSQGTPLTQADFILTLLSVVAEELRQDLEAFAKACTRPAGRQDGPSPYNHFIDPSAAQLLRVAIAIGFHRGKLKGAYQVLRGKDPETSKRSEVLRRAQLATLREAQAAVLDLNHWHGFLSCLVVAGFRSRSMISSENALLFSYVFYLAGKIQCDVDEKSLKRLIGRWFFATSLTGRYTGSSETVLESDLSRIRDMTTPEPFIALLEGLIASMLPEGYFETTLQDALETSRTDGPAVLAYVAAQALLAAPVLFSDHQSIAELIDPATASPRKPLEQHHLFPRHYLNRIGVKDAKHTDQAANFALVEWEDNADMLDAAPSEYLPRVRKKFGDAAWDRMCKMHALPEGWDGMSYEEFLPARRDLMSDIIREGFDKLSSHGASGCARYLAEGTQHEQQVWGLIERVELRLRTLVSEGYVGRWGEAAEKRMHAVLGDQAWEVIERNRAKDLKKNKVRSVVDYMYLGQLGTLATANDTWEVFKPVAVEKVRLIGPLERITPVRNDRAHFRSVPEHDLTYARLACEELISMLKSSE
jgi:hypothetical protein